MKTFEKSYLRDPWLNWSIFHAGNVPQVAPSQQSQEAWHRDLMRARIPGECKQSNERVLQKTLPRLIDNDALFIPDKLNWKVDDAPASLYEEADFYVRAGKENRMRIRKTGKVSDTIHRILPIYISH